MENEDLVKVLLRIDQRLDALEHFAEQATTLINALIEIQTPKQQGPKVDFPPEFGHLLNRMDGK